MMAKRSKKTSKFLLIISAIFFFAVGIVGGTCASMFLVESYIIPPVEATTQNVTEGFLDVDVVKSKELSIHFIELGNKYTGDCTLIKVGVVEILIDAGSRASSVEPIYDYLT